MSASSKKKLRKEQVAAQMTERQIYEQKEAKKLKLYTSIFTVALVALVVLALVFGVSKIISNSGVFEKNTVAVTVGEHEISNAELNYYFVAEVNKWVEQYGNYAALFGFDLSKPLDEQIIDEETGMTLADDLLAAAKNSAQADYALIDAANAAGFTLSETDLESIDTNVNNLSLYATLSNYSSAESYLKAMYGNGATMENYRAFLENNTLAQAYYYHYADSLTYDDAALRAKDDEDPKAYNSYSYNIYDIPASYFYEGGTTSESGVTTYTNDEKAMGAIKAEEVAKSLISAEITTVEELDKAIAALEMNAEKENVASTAKEDILYSKVNPAIVEWLSDDARVAGEIAYLPYTSNSTDAAGNTTTTINGYYIVMFHSVNNNTFALANVRHILVEPDGGKYNSNTGLYDYTEEEMSAAKEVAEKLLEEWKQGDADEESFGALANEKSDDGDGTTGGLYEDVAPGQMVEDFNSWCFEDGRKAGDTGIVESVYGWHIMYYVSDSETTYRDYMIENDLLAADVDTWYAELIESTTVTDGNTKYIETGLILNAG